MKNIKDHWNAKYQDTEQSKLGWYEETPQPSLDLIREFSSKEDVILDVGSGSSTLIDHLVNDGYVNIVATDISSEGLAITKKRLGFKASCVRFIVDDITAPTHISSLRDITMWHDRAVLHFLTTESERSVYLALLNKALKPGGFVILATFAVGGLTQCSGLDIRQYDAPSMATFLGDGFRCVRTIPHTYITTWGQARPFVYGVFQRIPA